MGAGAMELYVSCSLRTRGGRPGCGWMPEPCRGGLRPSAGLGKPLLVSKTSPGGAMGGTSEGGDCKVIARYVDDDHVLGTAARNVFGARGQRAVNGRCRRGPSLV